MCAQNKKGDTMYKITEEQRNTLIYIFNHLTTTGPDQGRLLYNAAAIVRELKPEPKPEPTGKEKKEEK